MPDRDVKTVKDQIFFQYAKIIACSAFKCANSGEAKKKAYGFIKNTFKALQSGKKSWSDILHEDFQFVEMAKACEKGNRSLWPSSAKTRTWTACAGPRALSN